MFSKYPVQNVTTGSAFTSNIFERQWSARRNNGEPNEKSQDVTARYWSMISLRDVCKLGKPFEDMKQSAVTSNDTSVWISFEIYFLELFALR